MGSLGVVVLNPFVHGRLCACDVLEDLPGVELQPKRLVEPFDLSGGGRRARLGEEVLDTVLPADPVKQHLPRGCAKRPVNTLPLSVSTWSGTPYFRNATLKPSHTLLVRSRCIKRAAMQNLEWSSSPVRALALVPSAR